MRFLLLILLCQSCFGQTVATPGASVLWNKGPFIDIPSSIAGLYARYEVINYSGFVNGTKPNELTNLASTGTALNLAQNTALQQPYWTNNASVYNGKPWLCFSNASSGTSTFMQNLNFQAVQPIHVFQLAWVTLANNFDCFVDGTNSAAVCTAFTDVNATPGVDLQAATARRYASVTQIGTPPLLREFLINGASSTVVTNGVQIGAANNPGANRMSGLSINKFSNSGTLWAGIQLSSMLIYTQQVTGADLTNLRNYFKTNYNAY